MQEKAVEIAKKYGHLSMRDKIGIIAQTFGYKSGVIETSPCYGKWRGTSDMSILFDNGMSLGLANYRTPQAKTAKVQNECVNTMLLQYNPEIVAIKKETALAALRKREVKDNMIAEQKGLKPYTLLNVELYTPDSSHNAGYIGWYFVTLAVDGKIRAHLESGLNYEIAHGQVGEALKRDHYYVAGALKEDEVDYVFNNVGHSSTSELYTMPMTEAVRRRAEMTLADRSRVREQERKPSIKAQLAAKPVPSDQPVKPKDKEAR